MSIRFYKGVDEETKLQVAGCHKVLARIAQILREDEESSIKNMAKDEICQSHALLGREIGAQKALRSVYEMINQIIGDTQCQTQPRSQTTKKAQRQPKP
jgi:hypothetical protein